MTRPRRRPAAVVAGFLVGWRDWPGRVRRLWRRSLQVRTVAITLALSLVAILATGVSISQSVANDLFTAKRDQVLDESARAARQVQQAFDTADSADEAALNVRVDEIRSALSRSVPSASGLFALLRSRGQSGPILIQGFTSIPDGVIGDALRERVATGDEAQYWQSVPLDTTAGDAHAGLVVGARIATGQAGQYELYTAFDLADEQATLRFVQQTLLIAGLVLVLLIGGIAWVIVRLVVHPVRVTAETTSRLAAGELEVRLSPSGEDEIATLARSFNGMADSLQRQILQLAELSQVQQRFVSDVSHELRTPLTTISLAADVLYDRRDDLDPAAARSVELLHTQIARLSDMLADLLEISRHDAGAADLEIEPTSLAKLVEDVVTASGPLADGVGSELVLIAPGGHATADFDPRRIRRIVRNLIDNAIEHGEGRPIRITVDSNQTAVAVSVADHGIGIAAADQERVFDRFWRADPSRRRTLGGTGLGLAISLEDASLHGGWLQVWSEPGAGTRFRLTLPRAAGGRLTASPLPLEPTLEELEASGADPGGPA